MQAAHDSVFPWLFLCSDLACHMLASSFAVPEAVNDVKVKAVNEMMERIKHGVVLRPVKGQDTKVILRVFMKLIVVQCFVFYCMF